MAIEVSTPGLLQDGGQDASDENTQDVDGPTTAVTCPDDAAGQS